MARLGMSPQREKLLRRQPRRVTLTMITHIPHLQGYYKDHIRLTELSLESMISNASNMDREFDVVIFDQDSCAEWKQKLVSMQDSFYIDGLYLSSYNVGKLNALRFLMGSIQSEIMGYTDDDVLFYPGWLDAHMELLDNIDGLSPTAVSGSPVATRFKWYMETRALMDQTGFVEEVSWRDMPYEWIEQDALCRGLHPKDYEKILDRKLEDDVDPAHVTFDDETKAWIVGHHMQFVGLRERMLAQLPLTANALMGQMREWDINMDTNQEVHLTTFDRTCRHMGNVLDNDIVNEAIDMGIVI